MNALKTLARPVTVVAQEKPLQAFIYSLSRNTAAKPVGICHLNPSIFSLQLAANPRVDILHRCVVHHLSLMRGIQNRPNEITRAQAEGSRRKIRPQKGQGRARVSSRLSPVFGIKGIKAFPRTTRDHRTKLNKKIKELGLRIALSVKYRNDLLRIVKEVKLDDEKADTDTDTDTDKVAVKSDAVFYHSTKEALKSLNELKMVSAKLNEGKKCLIVLDKKKKATHFNERMRQLQASNDGLKKLASKVKATYAKKLTVYDVLTNDTLLLTKDGLFALEERLQTF
jgi:ribosomal protein L4